MSIVADAVDARPRARVRSDDDAAPRKAVAAERLTSLDAYRGLTMLLMVCGAMRLPQFAEAMARRHPAHAATWERVAFHVEHAPWVGASVWDMIQPSFMFMVGVAVPFSIASRVRRGHGFGRQLLHAIWRALMLVALAVFISSNWSKRTNWSFTNVLAQIGLGYVPLFLLAWARPRWQAVAAGVILVGYWAAFAAYTPVRIATPEGAPADWTTQLGGFAGHWDKNVNVAAAVDRWFLNRFPREKPFEYERGGYQTLNFVPSLATMIFGLLAGGLLRSPTSNARKVTWLLLAGAGGASVGYALGYFGACPIVKRIWTPSWTLYAGGWTCLTLALFYVVCDVWRLRAWALPLVVIGANSIAIYLMYQLMQSFLRSSLRVHLGGVPGFRDGDAFVGQVQGAVFVAVLWLTCAWMYRRRVFVRI